MPPWKNPDRIESALWKPWREWPGRESPTGCADTCRVFDGPLQSNGCSHPESPRWQECCRGSSAGRLQVRLPASGPPQIALSRDRQAKNFRSTGATLVVRKGTAARCEASTLRIAFFLPREQERLKPVPPVKQPPPRML